MIKFKAWILTFLTLFMFFISGKTAYVQALSDGHSDVLYDLKLDESFNENDYPVKSVKEVIDKNLPTLEVIQIAESVNKELFIYVYQPTHNELDLKALKISMDTKYSSNGQNLDLTLYDLDLVSSKGVFDKYLVKDFIIKDDIYRYYNIVAIYREYNEVIDTLAGGSDIDDYKVGVKVGQQWCAYWLNDKVVYEMGTFETLDVTIKYTENFEFTSGLELGNFVGTYNWGLSWFVVFDVEDYIVKHIYDADMSYKIRKMSWQTGFLIDPTPTYEEWSNDIKITLSDTDVGSYKGDGLGAKEYVWNRISSAKDFLKNAENQKINVKKEAKEALNKSQWVFAFVETKMTTIGTTSPITYYSYDISNVTILRLHFVDAFNRTYDLGVVSDMVNPDNVSGGVGGNEDPLDWLKQLLEKLGAILGIIILILILIVAWPIVSILLSVLWAVIKLLFKVLVAVISLPFKLIGNLFKKKE